MVAYTDLKRRKEERERGEKIHGGLGIAFNSIVDIAMLS